MSTNPHNPYLLNKIKNLINREKQKQKETVENKEDPIDKIFNYNAHIVKPQKTLDNFVKSLNGGKAQSVKKKLKEFKDFKEMAKRRAPSSKKGGAIDDNIFKSAFMKNKDNNINEEDYFKDLKALHQLKSRQRLNEQKEKKKDNVNELLENLKKKRRGAYCNRR